MGRFHYSNDLLFYLRAEQSANLPPPTIPE